MIATATKPELAVYEALTKLGIEFEYQSPFLGGRTLKGGVVADFYIPSLRLIISVVGSYWHNQPGQRAIDRIQNETLASKGITTIYIDEDDVNRNVMYYVREALKMKDHSGYRG